MSETNQGRTRLPFSMIPEWVTYADISHGAVRLYSVIARYADNKDYTAFPGRQTLADHMRVSTDTIDRYVKELENISAISVERRKVKTKEGKLRNQSNMYTLEVAPPVSSLHDNDGRTDAGSRADAVNGSRLAAVNGSRLEAAHNYNHLELEPIELENTCSNEFFPAVTSKEIAIIDNAKETVASMFEEFWDAYGKKEARKPAVKAWNKVIKDPAMAEMVIAKAKESKATRNPDYVKLAGGWLLDERWNDEMVDRQANKSKSSSTINYLKELAQAEGLFND